MDIEAILFKLVFGFKESKCNDENCGPKDIYLFNNYDAYMQYFKKNGYENVSKDILDLCAIMTTKKGSVIVSSCLANYAIERHLSVCCGASAAEYSRCLKNKR